MVQAQMTDGFGGGTLDNQLTVFDPAGNAVGTATDALKAIVDLTLPATGPYLILAIDATGAKTGNYDLNLTGP